MASMILPIDAVFPNPDQPRQQFDQAQLEDLAVSLRERGQLQPIRVTPRGKRYMIVAGECRWRALQLNGATEVEAVIAENQSDVEVLIDAIVENRMRKNVHPLEEGAAFQLCIDAGMTEQEIATQTGLQQVWRVTERTCLLRLRPEYQTLFRGGHLGTSQAYEMAQLDPADQDRLFRAIKRGECSTYAQLRSTAAVLKTEATQTSLLGPDEVSPVERQLAKGLEKRVGQVIAVLRASTVDNEIVALK
ncbi:MAG TPA: ParB/RepB/Spo0J family partition protein, partial [Caulobacteraceae bacterium]